MINLSDVGATPQRDVSGQWQVGIGLYLPGITYPKGYTVKVRVIHEADQFVRGREQKNFWLDWAAGSALDLWKVTVPLVREPDSHFGEPGTHLYHFQLQRDGRDVTFWFSDPFGHGAGPGTLSAFRIEDAPQPFAWHDAGFRVPEVDGLIVYELNVREFNRDFQGVIDQLDYVQGLGVNVLELMPITQVKEDVEWGYTPLSYFAPDERLGGPLGFKRLVDACHQRGMAVILDSVYAHAHPEFAYNLVYDGSGEPNPMMGRFAGEFFEDRLGMDYTRAFTRDYFLALNQYWLGEYHVDGFRYDYVEGMYDGPVGQGYAHLVYHTYQASRALPRFDGGSGRSTIIQCAEYLPDPAGILTRTYTSCAWQNGLLDRARDMAQRHDVSASFAHQLDPEFLGFPHEYRDPASDTVLPVAPFQYLESHDYPRFINQFARLHERDLLGEPYGDRSRFYKLQPYIIALYTAKGIPMLWNGQEFGENWGLPARGIGRNLFERPLHWEYFYDVPGKALIRLYRILGSLRRVHRALGSRGYFYYYADPHHLEKQVIAYRREAAPSGNLPAEHLLILLNFADSEAEVWLPFPAPGTWSEQIDGTQPPVEVMPEAPWMPVTIPSNYGGVYKLG